MRVAIEQLGWPAQAADEKGVLNWRSKVADPAGEVVAKLGRYPDGISCKVTRINLAPPYGTVCFHASEWTLDGQLKSFEQYGTERPLDEAQALQAFTSLTQTLGAPSSYDCHGRLARMAPEAPAVIPAVPASRRPGHR